MTAAKLEEIKIKTEQQELSDERKIPEQLLKSATRLKTFIKNEIKTDAEKFGDARRSRLVEREEARAFSETELLSTEPVTIVLSERGWMRWPKVTMWIPAHCSTNRGTVLNSCAGKAINGYFPRFHRSGLLPACAYPAFGTRSG